MHTLQGHIVLSVSSEACLFEIGWTLLPGQLKVDTYFLALLAYVTNV